jgi:ferrochelatase
VIESFYKHETYLDALVEKVEEALTRFAPEKNPALVFSAHSLPVSVIEKGDPYQRQIEETVELLMQRGGWNNHYRLCYQSKIGASKWLQPSLHSTLRNLSDEGVKDVCIVPISFVSDHVETLGEIDHEAREEAHELGIERFEMTSGLNDSPKFIAALAQLVMSTLKAESVEHACLVAAD